jgi:predicted O-linked N-acetylglucosamine transferase (SPINDLY family)
MPRKIKQHTNPFLKAREPLATPTSQKLPNLENAVAHYHRGQLDQAKAICKKILEIEPRHVDAIHLLGVIAYQTGNHQVAVDLFSRAIEINPNIADFYSNLGVALQELKQIDAALVSYNKAITLQPDYIDAYYNRGNALKVLKQFEAAVASYDKAIFLRPDYAEAYSNLGVALQELKQLDAALVSYNKAIQLKPDYAEAYSNRGIALKELKQFEAAVASYMQAIELKPELSEAYSNLGVALQELKQIDAALVSYNKAIQLKPDYAEAYSNRGNALKELKQFEAAVASYMQAIELKPDLSEAYSNLGVALQELKQFEAAVASYDKAIFLRPDYAEAYSNLGVSLQELKQLDAALVSYNKAISLQPDYSDAYYNRGNALKELKQFEDAIASYDKAIVLRPDYAEAYSNRGNVLKELKQLEAAIASYTEVIKLKPDYAEAYSNLGNALKELKQYGAAVACYEKAIFLRPDYAEAYSNLGVALQELKQLDAALVSYNKAFELKPDYEYLFGVKLHIKMHLCDWQDFKRSVFELSRKIQSNVKASTCLPILALPIGLADQRKAAETWCADKHPFNPSLGPIIKSTRKSKIRIGYYSEDFHTHPVSILSVGLFEHHDKSQFELIAFSFNFEIQDEIRGRIKNAFDKFIDVSSMSDKNVAALSRKLGVDIAIDLGGYTKGCRTGIFSYRAAPIQLSYIGYLGTMGASYYDYLIADQTLIPEKYQPFYSEKIVYLPSYQVNDNKQEIPRSSLSRQELNLPSSGFIYCCFNANYKITPSTFDGWMRILNAVPESVLLLYTDVTSAAENLKFEAKKRGVSPERLIFGNRLVRSEYLARCRSADLFLDTLPYNSGATASDALWAGLPVLTCMGEGFAGRYAASLLNAIGLPELVTETQTDYEALAIELATNPAKLKAIKGKLEKNRLTTSLFDTAMFAKHIEAAYSKMYEQYQADLLPEHIYINDVDTKDKT